MKISALTVEGACAYLEAHRERFPFMMKICLSQVQLGTARLPADLTEVMEARYFGPECELRFFDDGNGLEAALFQEEPGDVFLDQKSRLLPKFGKTLTKRQYVSYDGDGQGYIETVRLVSWEGGQENG